MNKQATNHISNHKFSRFRDRPKKAAPSLLTLIAEKQAKLERLGLPEGEARPFALRLAKNQLGIE